MIFGNYNYIRDGVFAKTPSRMYSPCPFHTLIVYGGKKDVSKAEKSRMLYNSIILLPYVVTVFLNGPSILPDSDVDNTTVKVENVDNKKTKEQEVLFGNIALA